MSQSMLDIMLRPLEGYYSDPDHEEIAINQPGEIWCRLRRPKADGRVWVRVTDSSLNRRYLLSVCHAIANMFDKPFHPHEPNMPSSLFGTIPPAGHRFAAVAGAAVQYDMAEPEGGIAMCIRQGVGIMRREIQYKDWGIEEGQGIATTNLANLDLTNPEVDALGAIRDAIANGMHLLVSGGTSTGKTNLLNRIINELNDQTRIITLEDTREIRLPRHANHVHLMLNRTENGTGFTYNSAIDVITRFTPDIVLVGEVSTTNAAALWNLTGTGHGSMMCTIHASSPEEAYKTLVDRIAASASYQINREETLLDVQESFCVVQLERDHHNNRRLTAVRPPQPKRFQKKPQGLVL